LGEFLGLQNFDSALVIHQLFTETFITKTCGHVGTTETYC